MESSETARGDFIVDRAITANDLPFFEHFCRLGMAESDQFDVPLHSHAVVMKSDEGSYRYLPSKSVTATELYG